MGARFFVLAISAALAGSCLAQVTGRLTGSVTDASGAAIPHATINLFLPGGAKPLLTTVTTSDGLFSFTGVRPITYDLIVEVPGFLKYSLRGVKIDPARETALPAIQLELAAVATAVDVKADAQTVQTSNAEISTTVTNEQVRRLPMLDRDPMALIATQAGVSNNADDIVINGTRSSYSNVTLDGINIQDNFIRTGGLGFQPNLLLLDQVSEFTVSTSNTNSTIGGGSSQVTVSTPSGSNDYHGAAYWYNRNNALAAGAWFDNKDGIPKAFLNQNQLGGLFSGRIIKDKLFFYTNYEAFRNRQKVGVDNTILTASARQGDFTYLDGSGNAHTVNILTLTRNTIDPAIQNLINQIPAPDKINNFRTGDSSASLLRNTAGYSFDQDDNRNRDNVTARIDYNLSTKHAFATSVVWNRDLADRPDAENDFSVVPKVTNHDHATFMSSSWRWNPSPHLVNEVRGGFNLAPINFPTTETIPSYFITGLSFSSPVNYFLPQGRTTNTYSLQDNATYIRGRHTFQFGFQSQFVRISQYDDSNIVPTYNVATGDGQVGLTQRQLPGVSANDLDDANALLATLAGLVDSYGQVFNVTSRTSGFVPNAPFMRHYSFDNYAAYIHDTWKISNRVTATLGLRYEYYTVLTERDSLELTPEIQNGNYINTLLSDATLNFAGNSVGRPFYKPDYLDFAPNIGLAWDVFGTGKTAIRAGYSIHYVNDELVSSILNNIEGTNEGLQGVSQQFGLSGTISKNLPAIPVPAYQVPIKQSQNFASDPTSVIGIPDPNLRPPYVQDYTFGIQHEVKNTLFELRYVGNHGVKEFRAFDYNQVNINLDGFLPQFITARNNGFLSLQQAGVFNPLYNPSIKGSQQIPIFNQIFIPGRGGTPQGGLATSDFSDLVQTGEPAELLYQYLINGFSTPVNFFPNPVARAADTITNFSNSSYNSLQFDARRRVIQGLNFQGNYTFSKVLSDAAGDDQTRYEAFLDIHNTKIERAPAPFDIRHAFKANFIYDLPAGKGHRFNSRRLGGLLGGWSLSGIWTYQSGSPFSIVSGRGTLNYEGRSAFNTADVVGSLNNVVGFFMTGNGPYIINPSAIGADGRGVAADGSPKFNGQVFANPGPGTIGVLQRRSFYGPWTFDLDAGIQKLTHITEHHTVEFRMEVGNVLNHPSFYASDQNINATTFGQITSTFSTSTGRREVQFGLYYRF